MFWMFLNAIFLYKLAGMQAADTAVFLDPPATTSTYHLYDSAPILKSTRPDAIVSKLSDTVVSRSVG